MYVFYKEKKYLIISLLILILDGIMMFIMPVFYHQINYFYPMFTISLIPFLYYDNIKDYYNFILIIGIIYDLLYSNLFFFNGLMFLLLSKIDIKILKLMKNNYFTYLILVIINILLYDFILFILVSLNNKEFVINEYFYKIVRSLSVNIFISIIYYLIFKRNTTYLRIRNSIHQK